jgi:hypothetical protein
MPIMSNMLRGCCACGRNRYVVEVPAGSVELAQVFFDTTTASRQCTKVQHIVTGG